MPAPPPNGVSSTVRWTSVVWSRRSWQRRSSRPASRALPSRLSEQKPSTRSGKIVKTSMRTGSPRPSARQRLEQAVGAGRSRSRRPRTTRTNTDRHEGTGRPARADRGPGWPPRRPPSLARCRPVLHAPWSRSARAPRARRDRRAARRAARRRPALGARAVDRRPRTCTSQRSWCGRAETTTSTPRSPATAGPRRQARLGAVGHELDDDLTLQTVGLAPIRPTSRAVGFSRRSRRRPRRRRAWRRPARRCGCSGRCGPAGRSPGPVAGRHAHLEQIARRRSTARSMRDGVGLVDEGSHQVVEHGRRRGGRPCSGRSRRRPVVCRLGRSTVALASLTGLRRP